MSASAWPWIAFVIVVVLTWWIYSMRATRDRSTNWSTTCPDCFGIIPAFEECQCPRSREIRELGRQVCCDILMERKLIRLSRNKPADFEIRMDEATNRAIWREVFFYPRPYEPVEELFGFKITIDDSVDGWEKPRRWRSREEA